MESTFACGRKFPRSVRRLIIAAARLSRQDADAFGDQERRSRLSGYIGGNGLYVCLDAGWRRLTSGARNYLLGKTFHIRQVSIGSGAFLRGLSQVQLGENFQAGNGLWLQALNADGETGLAPKIIIGANFSMAFWGHIAALNRIVIGSDVMVGSKVTIIDHNHGSYRGGAASAPTDPPRLRPLVSRPVLIGSKVWIGDGVVVTAGAEIGEGSVIGANSVVTGRVAPFTVAVGVPARPVKTFCFERQLWVSCSESRPRSCAGDASPI
jgi:lipopolysaccharide O-acetyltransferase